jgi:hypothetical protein
LAGSALLIGNAYLAGKLESRDVDLVGGIHPRIMAHVGHAYQSE